MSETESDALVLVIHGPAGVGKDTIIAHLQERTGIHRATSSTDRRPRANEQDGVDYHFLTTEVFERKIAAGEFLEYARVYDDWKGIERSEIEEPLKRGQDVIIRTDVQGARHWREVLPGAISILLVADDDLDNHGHYHARLRGRATEDEESLRRRTQEIAEELADQPNNDYVVVNRHGEVEQAVDELVRIIHQERAAGGRRVRLER